MGVLFQIDADDEAAIRSKRARHACQELGRLCRRQIADGRARKEADFRSRAQIEGIDHLVGEIAEDRMDVERWKARLEPLLRPGERGIGDIDRNVGSEIEHFGKQELGLAARTGAEFDEDGAVRNTIRNVGSVGCQNRGLGARRIIFGNAGDRFEKLAAARVVEIAAGQRPRRRGKPVDHRLGELIRRRHPVQCLVGFQRQPALEPHPKHPRRGEGP